MTELPMTDIRISLGSPLAGPAHFLNHRDLRTVRDEGLGTGDRDKGLRVCRGLRVWADGSGGGGLRNSIPIPPITTGAATAIVAQLRCR